MSQSSAAASQTISGSLWEILDRATEKLCVLQEFCPLADSLEWQLGQRYLHQRGSKAFTTDASPVPFVVNNDGSLSRLTAEVFFSNLSAAEQASCVEPEICVLELGIGVGLFARFFLDAFRHLCRQNSKDYYDRLIYIAADCSEQMLRDAARQGIFADHPGRYQLRIADALDPFRSLLHDCAFLGSLKKPIRAVFLNYLLDCLPASVLEIDGPNVKRLCVRTGLSRGVNLVEYTDRTTQELAQLASSGNQKDERELLELYPLMNSEYAYLPVEPAQIAYEEFVFQVAGPKPTRILHSYGAIQCLERLLELVRGDGFILANDYGTARQEADAHYEHQRFSQATFIGVNFPLLKAYFGDAGRCQWAQPAEERESMHACLLGAKFSSETVDCFLKLFSKASFEQLETPVQSARQYVKMGRLDMALGSYGAALHDQPYNWVLMNEIAQFLTFALGDCKAGADMAKAALSANPTCSSELWNTLGDALFAWGRIEESKQAYRRALQINENDVRGRMNLAWVYDREKAYPDALRMIAEGLALDHGGQYRESLLQKQQEVLQHLAVRQRREAMLVANRINAPPPNNWAGMTASSAGIGAKGQPPAPLNDQPSTVMKPTL